MYADLGELGPTIRDPDQLRSQDRETDEFLETVMVKKGELEEAKRALAEARQQQGAENDVALKFLHNQNARCETELEDLRKKGEKRKTEIARLLEGITS